MSFFKDLKEDIAQSVNELAESLDDGLDVSEAVTEEPMTDADFVEEQTSE